MKKGSIELVDLEFEYKLWKGRLNVYINELELLLKRNNLLREHKQENMLNSIELTTLEEHKNELQSLLKQIEIKEQELTFYNKDFPITKDHEYYKDHINLRINTSRLFIIHYDRVNDIIMSLGV